METMSTVIGKAAGFRNKSNKITLGFIKAVSATHATIECSTPYKSAGKTKFKNETYSVKLQDLSIEN